MKYCHWFKEYYTDKLGNYYQLYQNNFYQVNNEETLTLLEDLRQRYFKIMLEENYKNFFGKKKGDA